jgi:PAS domain-containing protein
VVDAHVDEPRAQKPLELILARNLITSLSTPAFIVDPAGGLLFYNEAAGALLGMSFEEAGRMTAEEWIGTFGPFDDDGRPIPVEDLPLTAALRAGRPSHARLRIRSTKGDEHEIAASGLPIVGADRDSSGAMLFFWPTGELSQSGGKP